MYDGNEIKTLKDRAERSSFESKMISFLDSEGFDFSRSNGKPFDTGSNIFFLTKGKENFYIEWDDFGKCLKGFITRERGIKIEFRCKEISDFIEFYNEAMEIFSMFSDYSSSFISEQYNCFFTYKHNQFHSHVFVKIYTDNKKSYMEKHICFPIFSEGESFLFVYGKSSDIIIEKFNKMPPLGPPSNQNEKSKMTAINTLPSNYYPRHIIFPSISLLEPYEISKPELFPCLETMFNYAYSCEGYFPF